MKLYMKQKIFSWRDRFTVRDENNTDVYAIEGEILTLGKRLHVYDRSNQEAAYIEQKILSMRPRYTIHIGTRQYEMIKEFTLLRQRYRLTPLDWKMEGNFMSHEFSLTEGGQTLMQVYKEWFTWGDSYALEIASPEHALLCLCMVLVADCILDNADNN